MPPRKQKQINTEKQTEYDYTNEINYLLTIVII